MTTFQLEAISETLQQAVSEQEDYQSYGNPHVDYGEEWPETARSKARRFRTVAEWLKSENGWYGLITDLENVAEALEASAKEYEEAQ